MYLLLLSLLCLCESSTLYASAGNQSARRRHNRPMSITQLHECIEIQKLEQNPCTTVEEFAYAQELYSQARKSAGAGQDRQLLQTKLALCNEQLGIMQTAATVLATLTSADDIAIEKKALWLSLRDFYEPTSDHWSCYNNKADAAGQKLRRLRIEQLQALYNTRNRAELANTLLITCDAEQKTIATTLLERIDAEDLLKELKENGSNPDLIRNAHLHLLNTYAKETPEYEQLFTTILRNDLFASIETLEDKSLSNEEYFTKKIALTDLLAQTHPVESTEHTALSEEIEVLKHRKNHAQLLHKAKASLSLVANEQTARRCIRHFETLLGYTKYINEKHELTYPIDDIIAQLEQLANRTSYYHHVHKLEELKASHNDTRAEQCELLRAIIPLVPCGELTAPYQAGLTYLEKHLEKERLLDIIHNTPEENLSDIVTKIRCIRDELLPLNILDGNEQINWQSKLAQLYALRKIKGSNN